MRKQTTMGSGLHESMAHFIETLIQKRDFVAVVEYYDAHRAEIDGAGDDLAGSMLRRIAMAHASLSHYPIALKIARTAQAKAARLGESVLLAEIFMTIGGILRDMGELKEAERAFRDAESIFRRNDCPEGQSRALNLLAGLFFHMNDYKNSLAILMDAVQIARKLGDRKKLAYMMGNIGRVQTFVGDFNEAERYLKMNVDLSEQLGDDPEAARAQLSLAYVQIQAARFEDAETVLRRAQLRIDACGTDLDRIILLTYLGELQRRTGRLNDAESTLLSALTLAEKKSPGTALEGRALRQLAELYVQNKNYRLAQKFAARAMVVLEKVEEQVEISHVRKVRGVIAAATGKTETAVREFEAAIDQLDQTGVRWEKFDVMTTAALTGALPRRQSLLYLLRAEEYYSRRGITRRLEQIGRDIRKLDAGSLRAAPTESAAPSDPSLDYLTASPDLQRIKSQLAKLGKSELPLLLTGETGVGKDRMARYYHACICAGRPYVAINCASVPETLLESELFGYRRGAFTGADADKPGLFVKANGGVLFLDEIGDMPLVLQAKLLGVLERRKVMPLGSTEEVSLDFKLVAATNHDLEKMVEEGRFRRDLYYRLSGIAFHIPPLRERKEDIPLLVNWFMRKQGLIGRRDRLPADIMRRFLEYGWPGNIRELENKVKRLEVMADMVADGDLGELARLVFDGDSTEPDSTTLFERVEEFERQLIMEAVLAARGNKCEAARLLGIHEATVRTKLKRYGIVYEGGAVAKHVS